MIEESKSKETKQDQGKARIMGRVERVKLGTREGGLWERK